MCEGEGVKIGPIQCDVLYGRPLGYASNLRTQRATKEDSLKVFTPTSVTLDWRMKSVETHHCYHRVSNTVHRYIVCSNTQIMDQTCLEDKQCCNNLTK